VITLWLKCALVFLAAALAGPWLIRWYGVYWDYVVGLPLVKGG
jgi:hypothetical protein